jgi:hypothetical protein
MSSTTETTKPITFRRYKDGDNKIHRLNEKIFQAREAARRAKISAVIWPSLVAPKSRR